MSTPTKRAPGRCSTTAGGVNLTTRYRQEGLSSMNTISGECRHCTVPTDHPSGLCGFCRFYDGPSVDSDLTRGTMPAAAVDRLVAATVPPAAELLADAKLSALSATAYAVDALDALADDGTILLAAADLSSAIAHLRAARQLLNRAAAQLDNGRSSC